MVQAKSKLMSITLHLPPQIETLLRLGIFGSVARNKATDESDIDIVIEMEQPDLFTSVHIKEDLEAEFNRSVDLVHSQGQTNKYLAARIAKDAVYV